MSHPLVYDHETILSEIEALLALPSPSGLTRAASDYVIARLQSLGLTPERQLKGHVVVDLTPDLDAHDDALLLTAHLDTLGLMVTTVKSNGRLSFSAVGGFPFNNVENENVQVRTRDGRLYSGTVRLNTPSVHASRDVGSTKRDATTMEIVLDEDTSDDKTTKALGIAAGDFVFLDPRTTRAGNGYLKSRHLDDKASCGLLICLADALRQGLVVAARKTYALFSVHEEIGYGASSGHPAGVRDMIAVDMGVVGEGLGGDETKLSICAKDASGPFNDDMTTWLVNAASSMNLPYVVDVFPFYKSDAAAALCAGYNYRHALIGPGVACSHAYERTHIKALEATLALLAYAVAHDIGTP